MKIQVLHRDLTIYGDVTGFESFDFTKAWNSPGEFKIVINKNNENAELLQHDKIVYIEEDNFYGYIDSGAEEQKKSESNHIFTVKGAELKDRLERVIYPATNMVTDSYSNEYIETVIKTLIDKNAGTDASSKRQIPNLVTAELKGIGESINYSARYKDLSSEIYSLLSSQRMGLNVALDFTESEIIFDVLEGNDLTGELGLDKGIVFSLENGSLLEILDTDDRTSFKNLSVTAGLGKDENQEVQEVYLGDTEPEGYDRKEVFTEASDISSNDEIPTRGAQKLSTFAKTRGIKAVANTVGSYVVGKDYDLGDYVSIKSNNTLFDVQVIKLKYSYDNKSVVPKIDIIFDYDVDDDFIGAMNARHMDYDALMAAGANGRVAARVEVDEETGTVIIDDLDINADGGLYEIIVFGKTSANLPYYIEYNNIYSNTNYKTQQMQILGTNLYPTSANDARAAIGFTTAFTAKHIITLPNGYPMCITENTAYSGGSMQWWSFGQVYGVRQTNITSIRLRIPGANFAVGTTVMVFKR